MAKPTHSSRKKRRGGQRIPEPQNVEPADHGPLSPGSSTFPKKLLEILNLDGNENILAWSAHGLSFFIKDVDIFVAEILRKYFRHTKLTSFQRQLNLYGFRRITKGPDVGAYFHPHFRRDRVDLVAGIKRLPGQGATATAKYLPLYHTGQIAYMDVKSIDREIVGGRKEVDSARGSRPKASAKSVSVPSQVPSPVGISEVQSNKPTSGFGTVDFLQYQQHSKFDLSQLAPLTIPSSNCAHSLLPAVGHSVLDNDIFGAADLPLMSFSAFMGSVSTMEPPSPPSSSSSSSLFSLESSKSEAKVETTCDGWWNGSEEQYDPADDIDFEEVFTAFASEDDGMANETCKVRNHVQPFDFVRDSGVIFTIDSLMVN